MNATLPQLAGRRFLTDGGLETTLIFHDGLDLPCFAAFTLLASPDGRARLDAYYRRYAAIAEQAGTGFLLESASWRASPDWAERLGMSLETLDALNMDAVRLMKEVAHDLEAADVPAVLSGCVGPRRDGYQADLAMSAAEAQAYHGRQIGIYAGQGVDLVSAITMTNSPEAIGIVRAAEEAGVPAVISFTVETDACLPTGQPLGEAIEEVDAATDGAAAYFMVNCAHPLHFAAALETGGDWVKRIGGVRANASTRSHAELDEAQDLDDGDPEELGRHYRALVERHPQITVLGGCCGTDHRHIAAIAEACSTSHAPSG